MLRTKLNATSRTEARSRLDLDDKRVDEYKVFHSNWKYGPNQ